jgi:hypothetical protein
MVTTTVRGVALMRFYTIRGPKSSKKHESLKPEIWWRGLSQSWGCNVYWIILLPLLCVEASLGTLLYQWVDVELKSTTDWCCKCRVTLTLRMKQTVIRYQEKGKCTWCFSAYYEFITKDGALRCTLSSWHRAAIDYRRLLTEPTTKGIDVWLTRYWPISQHVFVINIILQ